MPGHGGGNVPRSIMDNVDVRQEGAGIFKLQLESTAFPVVNLTCRSLVVDIALRTEFVDNRAQKKISGSYKRPRARPREKDVKSGCV